MSTKETSNGSVSDRPHLTFAHREPDNSDVPEARFYTSPILGDQGRVGAPQTPFSKGKHAPSFGDTVFNAHKTLSKTRQWVHSSRVSLKATLSDSTAVLCNVPSVKHPRPPLSAQLSSSCAGSVRPPSSCFRVPCHRGMRAGQPLLSYERSRPQPPPPRTVLFPGQRCSERRERRSLSQAQVSSQHLPKSEES